MMNRRTFAGSLLCGGAAGSAAPAKLTKPLSVQLYTVREQLPKDPRGTLTAIRKIGFNLVEPTRPQLEYAAIMKELGLTPASAHFEAPLVTGNFAAWKEMADSLPKGYGWAQAIEEAKRNGVRYVVISYLQKAERDAPGFYEKFADQMNHAGEQSLKAGVQLCYHHHSFEFVPKGGTTSFAILAERFDPKLVQFELDVFWIKMAGQDPVKVLHDLKGRVPLVHLKDVAAGAKTEFDERKVAFSTFKEVGSGSLDIPAILKACDETGVQIPVVEQDQCEGLPIDSLAKSVKYLRGLA